MSALGPGLILLGLMLLSVAAGIAKRTPRRAVAHAGAVAGWSPARDVAAATLAQDDIADLAATERAELADAAADLAPLITAEHDALALAWRAFDEAMAGPLRTVQVWHNADHAFCRTCSGEDGRIFGTLGDDTAHTGIRAFRTDTPTGEYPIIKAYTT